MCTVQCSHINFLNLFFLRYFRTRNDQKKKMGRLNKKLTKKLPKNAKAGLSDAAAKSLVNIRNVEEIPVDVKESAVTPFSNVISFSKHTEQVEAQVQENSRGIERSITKQNKKNMKTLNVAGKIVKLGKKEKMKIRKKLLVKKLSDSEQEKKEAIAKKKRETVVIIKDTKPLMENLEEIEEEIKREDLVKLNKPISKKKVSKSTMKKKKQKDQFMKDLEFLKAATQHSEYVANPMRTVTIHLQNSIQTLQ